MVTREEAIKAVEEELRRDIALKAIIDEYLKLFCGGININELDENAFCELIDIILEQVQKSKE